MYYHLVLLYYFYISKDSLLLEQLIRKGTTYTNLSINTLYKTAIITFDLCIKMINATYIIPKYIHQYKTIEYKILTHHTLSGTLQYSYIHYWVKNIKSMQDVAKLHIHTRQVLDIHNKYLLIQYFIYIFNEWFHAHCPLQYCINMKNAINVGALIFTTTFYYTNTLQK